MKSEDFKGLLRWFKQYVSGFYTGNPESDYAFRLKEAHTYRVCGNISLICHTLGLSSKERLLAKTMALFHDLGRFRQFRHYRTFNDRVSENHAALSISELDTHKVLSICRQPEKELIVSAITYHNVAALPERLPEQSLFFMRLLRDADKLDIWKVFCDHYRERDKKADAIQNKTIEMNIPDLPVCSEPVIAALQEGRCARVEDLKTLNDFKLLQISWVYDLNFAPSFYILYRHDYINQIAKSLPMTAQLKEIIKETYTFIHARMLPAANAYDSVDKQARLKAV